MLSSSSDLPTEKPCAARKVKHIPPPMTMLSAFVARFSMTASLSDTFEPPSTTAYGRSVELVSCSSTLISAATSVPA